MNSSRQYRALAYRLGWSLAVWIPAAALFGLIRVWGVESLPAFERVIPMDFGVIALQVAVLGLAIGVPFATMDHLTDVDWIRKMPYWTIIAIKSVLQVSLAVLSLTLLVFVSNRVRDLQIALVPLLISESALLWILYTALVSLLIHLIQVLKDKIGGRVLLNLLLGKYHKPRIETRVFMFLDMKDSTRHAESLGHIEFSSLIQDSFSDLTRAIVESEVEVYQYVGDEAVLTWKLEDAFRNANCLRTYPIFERTLAGRREYYERRYGFVPQFKAGVHVGEVTVSEVGTIKREIAYHSDVLNTASRIQGQCNAFDARLLISDQLLQGLGRPAGFCFNHIGGIALRGKREAVSIYAVDAN